MATLYQSAMFEKHQTGHHPETPDRTRVLREMLVREGFQKTWNFREPVPVSRDLLRKVHPELHIATIEAAANMGGQQLDADTVVSRDSFHVALHATGSAVAAVEDVLTKNEERSVCLVRPPGHHCRPTQAMGFCLFGNIAVAAASALSKHELRRVLIVDWDVHHGNGTQEIFYDSDRVHFFSAHRFPFYPGTGDSDETGTGDGLGCNWNLPLEFGISREKYFERFSAMLEKAAKKCRPELILISAGFDAHKDDPLGSLGLETEDFAKLTQLVVQTAEAYCDGRIVSVLEGGYNLHALTASVKVHLHELRPESE